MNAFTDMALGEPWAISEAGFRSFLNLVAAGAAVPSSSATKPARPAGTVAVIEIFGPILAYRNPISRAFGWATAEEILAAAQAASTANVSGVALVIDSPGGQVSGINAAADALYALRGRKPVKAYVSATAASGAYWIASAADEVIADDTAFLGSIGVMATFRDTRALDQRNGVRSIEIVSSQSPMKRPDPATDAGRAALQVQVDALADVFVARVARNRGVSAEAVLSSFGQGDVLIGARAVAAGMADRIGTRADALAAASGRPSPSPPQQQQRNSSMTSYPTPSAAEPPTESQLRAEWERSPDLRAEFGEFDTFAAFRKADAGGQVRILAPGRRGVVG